VYDYSEVRRAIEKTQDGEIKTIDALIAYVEQRRRELFEERFNEELRERLDAKLAQAKAELDETTQKMIEHQVEVGLQAGTEDIKRDLQNRINTLRAERDSLDKKNAQLVKDAAKYQDPKQLVERYEQQVKDIREESEQQQKKLYKEREEWRKQARLQFVEERAQLDAKMGVILAEERKKLEQEIKDKLAKQGKELELQHKQTETDLKNYYAGKTKELEIAAKVGVRDSSSHGVELIAQLQQWLVHITSEDMIKGLGWLPQAEIVQLVSSIRAVHGNLEEAEEKISNGKTVVADGENTVTSEPIGFIDERRVARW
jgi:DNA repair exonuclease SbcCD ATPase subunit